MKNQNIQVKEKKTNYSVGGTTRNEIIIIVSFDWIRKCKTRRESGGFVKIKFSFLLHTVLSFLFSRLEMSCRLTLISYFKKYRKHYKTF